MSLPDAAARERIRTDLGTTFVVEAAAGTGKTSELVARVLAVVRAGVAGLDRIAAVTFTDKAAGELKLRLRAELERARSGAAGDEREHLDAALVELETARIGTIHAICADLLREWPVEAGVDPLFEVAAGDDEARLFEHAFDGWFQEALADPGEGVRRLLRRRLGRRGGGVRGVRRRPVYGAREALREAARRLVEHRDFDGAWRRDPFDRPAALDDALVAVRGLAAVPVPPGSQDPLADDLAKIRRAVAEIDGREAAAGRDLDSLEADLAALCGPDFWRARGHGAWFGELVRGEVIARRDAARARLGAVIARCDADLAALLSAELRPVAQRLAALETRAGRLDFLELCLRARDLLLQSPPVLAEVRRRISHVFVDEFQDVDPLMAEILLLLAGDAPGALFVVGDPKQSIYRFRRAEPALYEEVKRRLLDGGAELLRLTASFRGVPALQEVVNASFAPHLADYAPLQPVRADAPGRPAVIALPAPRPYGDRDRILAARVEASYADAVGAFVAWLLHDSAWTVAGAPLEPRHVCLLFRRFQSRGDDVTRAYARALEARRVPHALAGGRSLPARAEAIALTNALAAIERPDDELALFATLRGPLFGFQDDALLAHRLGGETSPEIAGALGLVDALHQARNRRPIADTISRLLEATRAHAGLALWGAGEQALAAVGRLVELARRFEAGGATSFRAFVDRLEEGELGDIEGPPAEEGTAGVRLLTVHRAKGLEFPVVILCDPMAPRVQARPSRWVDAARRVWAEPLCGCAPVELVEHGDEALAGDEAEATRLAYVAATRARDLLVVPAVGEGTLGGWLDVLEPAIQPRDRRRPAPAPACPPFGADTVLERPVWAARGAAVIPGEHVPRAGAHRVVWWDPAVLALDAREEEALRGVRLLEDHAPGAAEGRARRAAWAEARGQALGRGRVPSHAVRTVTELAVEAAFTGEAPPDEVETVRSRPDGPRPRGPRFGALVHAVLAEGPASVRAAAAAHGRRLGAPADEIDAAEAAVSAALAHPLLQRAAAAAEARREVPVELLREDGTLVEGVVDLAFRDAGGWTVVDFKTDDAEAAAPQVALYARAVAAATGLPARAVVLAV